LTALGIGKHVETEAHRELETMCRIYGTTPDKVMDIWFANVSLRDVSEPGELVLRYVQRVQPKDEDQWEGPLMVVKKVGTRMVECKNLPTGKMVTAHANDLKKYSRPDVSSWKVNREKLPLEELDVYLAGFEDADLSRDWRKRRIFVDLNLFADLDDVYRKAGFRIWDCWVILHNRRQLAEAAAAGVSFMLSFELEDTGL
jgi:hypothetical protein